MAKHLAPGLKVSNDGTKWYRRVTNIGATNISTGQVVEWAFADISATSRKPMSADYALVQVASALKGGYKLAGERHRIAGVAIQTIAKDTGVDATQGGATIVDGRIYHGAGTAPGSGSGWIQFKGAAQICSRCDITVGDLCMIASTGNGQVMKQATPHASAGSAVVGYSLEFVNVAANGNGMPWVFLTLE